MNFIDEVIVEFASGKGGNGAVTFHREKHLARGGPNGADGGKGGDIILKTDRSKRTLFELKLQKKIKAENGAHAVAQKKGKNGDDLVIPVPIGTIVYDEESNEPLVDLNAPNMTYKLCKGGRGGHGNLHYVSSIRQAPKFAEKGEPEEQIHAKLELKLLADVGLVGLPNAGKSTLLSKISAAKPKIANYPFTTITPNLGVVSIAESTFTVADMPGLIELASEGVGLGHQFLKHIERTRVLVHLIDLFPMDETEPINNYHIIEKELNQYSEKVASKPRIVVLNKADLKPNSDLEEEIKPFKELGLPYFVISGATGKGVNELLFYIDKQLKESEIIEEDIIIPINVEKARVKSEWEVTKTDNRIEVTGKPVLRMVAMTDLNNRDALRYLHRRLERMGVLDKMRELGAEEGDQVIIGNFEFTYTDEL